jgi:cobalt-precorrin 5A hydrolase
MELGEAMIVAGIGCKKGSSEQAVMDAITTALAAHKLNLSALDALATAGVKANEAAIFEAARRFGLGVKVVDDLSLRSSADRCATHSEKSLAFSGVPSLSEAAALAAAGNGATLLGPRLVQNGVTCALARSGEPK